MKQRLAISRNHRPLAARAATALLVAAFASGCSFSWGSGGISDVLFGGRPAADIVEGQKPPEPGVEGEQAEAEQSKDEGESGSLRRIAILPVAWKGPDGGQPCDLCPPSLDMKPTTELQARLLTGFFYEAVARHPRLLFPTPEQIEAEVAATPGGSFRATAARLAASHRADLVIVAALLELRPRVGPDDHPEKPAGAAVYASLVDARSGKVLWSDTFDRDDSGRGVFLKAYDRVMNDKPVRRRTAEEYSEHAADELIDDLIDEID